MEKLLAAPSKVRKIEHHAALPYPEVGTFLAELRQQADIGACALEFTTLTVARSGEVRGATWAEVDMDSAVWTIPAERMEAGCEHRIPYLIQPVALLCNSEGQHNCINDQVQPIYLSIQLPPKGCQIPRRGSHKLLEPLRGLDLYVPVGERGFHLGRSGRTYNLCVVSKPKE